MPSLRAILRDFLKSAVRSGNASGTLTAASVAFRRHHQVPPRRIRFWIAATSNHLGRTARGTIGGTNVPTPYASRATSIARTENGRGERIRTSGPCLPKTVLYQAELLPDRVVRP